MEVEQNLLEYGKSMLINIKRGIGIYKSKLVEEKERFDSSIVKLLNTLTHIKDNFIFRTAQLEQKYYEINNRIEFAQKLNMKDIIGNANEINGYFCSVNTEFTDFLNEIKYKIKNEITQEGIKFFSSQCNNIQMTPPKNSFQPANDFKIVDQREKVDKLPAPNGINISNANFNSYSALSLSSNPNMNYEANFKQNEKNSIQILPTNSHIVNLENNNIKRDFLNRENSLMSINKNQFYDNTNENNIPSFNNNFHKKDKNVDNLQVKETLNNNLDSSQYWTKPDSNTARNTIPSFNNNFHKKNKNVNNLQEKETSSNNANNLDSSQYWTKPDSNTVKSNGLVNKSISEAFDKDNFSDCDNFQINKSEENKTEKLLSRKMIKRSQTGKLDYKFKEILSAKFNKNNQVNESQFSNEDGSVFYSSAAKSISKVDSEIVYKLQKIFPDMGIDFTWLDYLKNKLKHCFEFNLMNNQTVSKQIDNILNSNLIDQDNSILIKLTISSDECNAKSPVYHHLIEFFEKRCCTFLKNDMYIGGVCKISLRKLFDEIGSDSYFKYHKIIKIRLSIYYFFADILKDLDDINPTCKTFNLSKKEEKEKNHFNENIKKIRNEYEKIAK